MAQNRFVLLFVFQVALQKALLHFVFLAYRARTHAGLAHLSARVALGLVGFEVRWIVVRTRGVAARAHDILETFGRMHADGSSRCEIALTIAAGTLRWRALFTRL